MSDDSTPSGPFLRVFVNDWLDPASRINTLTPAQECAYFRLCLFQFRDPQGFLPDAIALLAHCGRIADADAESVLRPVLERFFDYDQETRRYSNPRVRSEWLRAHQRTEQATLAARKRWKSSGEPDADAERSHMQSKSKRENTTPLPPKGGRGVGSRTKAEIERLEKDPMVVRLANYWAKTWEKDSRSLGVLRAVAQALAAQSDPKDIALVIRTARMVHANPDPVPSQSSFRWAFEHGKLSPEYLLRPGPFEKFLSEATTWERND